MIARRTTIWIAGSMLLLGLNFYRNLHRSISAYDWQPVKRATLHRSISTQGVMEAVQVAAIISVVDETVLKTMVEEGQAVKKNQSLLELSQNKTKLEFDQRRNAYASADADFKKATREVSIQKKLLKNMAVSRSQVEDSEQALIRAQAALAIAKQELDLAQEKLNSTLVHSPINGVVLKNYVKVGDAVTAGKNLITVGDVSKFIVTANVDELDIQQVKVGQPVEITADAFPGVVMKGVIHFIASEADRDTFAKVEVRIDITDSHQLALKHNLSVRVNILTEDLPNSLGVPIKSILKKEENNAWVLVRNKMGIIHKKKIVVGKTAGADIQVASGLQEGDQVGAPKPAEPAP